MLDRSKSSGSDAGEIDDSEMTFAELAGRVRHNRLLVSIATLVGVLAGLGFAFTSTPIYRAQVLLAPVDNEQAQGALASLANQVGGLAALAGVSLTGNRTKSEEAIATLESRKLTVQYVQDKQLLPVLFAERWDAAGGRWKGEAPTLWDANQMFEGRVRRVNLDRLTGLVTMEIEWKDPRLAAEWANDLVARTNGVLRRNAIDRSERNISYLEEQQEKMTEVQVKDAIARLLENEIQTVMLAKGNEEYAFRVIDPAVPPRRPVWPPKKVLTAIGAFTGLLVGILAAVARGRKPRERFRPAAV